MGFTRAELEAFRDATLPDLVGPGLRLLFVGINPGLWTAAVQTHFAHPGNRFYPALRLAGILTRDIDLSRGMTDDDRRHLLDRGLGITNLVNRATARADELTPAELRTGSLRLSRWSAPGSRASSPSPASPPTAPPSAGRRPRRASSPSTSRAPASGSSPTPAA